VDRGDLFASLCPRGSAGQCKGRVYAEAQQGYAGRRRSNGRQAPHQGPTSSEAQRQRWQDPHRANGRSGFKPQTAADHKATGKWSRIGVPTGYTPSALCTKQSNRPMRPYALYRPKGC
jgi:hypothetical protein